MAFFEDVQKKFKPAPKTLGPDEILDKAIRNGKGSLTQKEKAILNEAYPDDVLKVEELDPPYYKEGKYH